MRKLKSVTGAIFATLIVLGFIGCGQENAYIADTTRPVVTATTPISGATAVPLGSSLTATFSKPMNSSTINASTFTLSGPGAIALSGTVSYAGLVATFVPSAALTANTTYTATITSGAQDTASPVNSLLANYVWTFTTAVPAAPPTVTSTVPSSGASSVPLTQAISANFSQAMNATTLTASTFTLTGPSGTVIPGAVTYNAATNSATLTPGSSLLPNSTYFATVTTGAQNTAGTALASNYVWVFRTVAAAAPPTVIFTNPANEVSSVPINQQIAATFSSAMNPATINSTTYTLTAPGDLAVPGKVSYVSAGSIATFAPSVPLAVSTTYVATITTGSKDSSGDALAVNYVWTFTTAAAAISTRPTVIATNPVNNATGVPFNQAITATFSTGMNAATVNTSSFTLTGPGLTPVTGMVTNAIGNSATFTPLANLLPTTLYTATITTSAQDLAGNALLANYVWTFTTGNAPATTKPFIAIESPVSGATGVAVTHTISATFNEAMNPLTITTATFQVSTGGVAIAGTLTYDAVNYIATFTPSTALTAGVVYTATISTGASDLAGNPLVPGTIPNPWSFTTGTVALVPPVNLGTAALFGGFGGGAGMTNMGTSTFVNGDIGTTGVSTVITGFHNSGPGCIYTETSLNIGFVNGAIDTAPPPPTVGCPSEGTAATSAIAVQAAADALTAYNELVAFPNGLDVSTCSGCGGGGAGELGNRTLAPGVYKSAPGTYLISLGDLTLDAQGDANAFWVFQMAHSLTVGTSTSPRNVLLVNGAQAKNVFWQVGSAATIEPVLGGDTMTGTIIAQTGISVSTAGVANVTVINGRLLVLTGPVTLVDTVINVPAP